MKIEDYVAMLKRQDFQSLVGIQDTIDAGNFPDRAAAVKAEIDERRSRGESDVLIKSEDPVPRWKIQKNWHRINGVLVGCLSGFALFSTVGATESGVYFDFEQLAFSVIGLLGVMLYFWKFQIGHSVLLFWWLPQLVQLETRTHRYAFFSGMNIGIEFQFGPLEILFNLPAILSFTWLILFKKYYERNLSAAAVKASPNPDTAGPASG